MDRLRDNTLARRLNAIALVVSVAIVLALPANHLFTAYEYESQRIQSDIQSLATDLSRLTFEKPEVWQSQEDRIRELVERAHSHGHVHDSDRHVRITDNSGNVIVELGNSLDFPNISGNSPIRDGAATVGTISLSEDVTHIWAHAITSLFLGIALGLAVFLILRYLPMRALLKREQQLQEITLQLEQAQRMEAIGQLTGGIAHDFNNLLGVVIGNLEFLEEQFPPDAGNGRMLLDAALKAALSGADLNRQMLAFSRQQELRRVSVDLADIVREMKDLLSRTLDDDINVITEETRTLWPCETDPAQVQNAILNLAINAADAMPDGGTLWIETNNLTLDAGFGKPDENFVPGDYIRLAVTDTGTGMTSEVIEHAFEPFFTTKDVGKGSGLGLSMIYGFIRQSGGYIRVRSRLGKGTTVALYLPRSHNAAVTSSNIVQFAKRGDGLGTILLVDDQPDVRRIASRILESLGYRVIEASDGPSALEALEFADHVDLLFTDVVMPGGLNGAELASEARNRVPGLKILFATGYSGEKSAVAEAAGIDALVLAKPYRRADVAEAIEATLAR